MNYYSIPLRVDKIMKGVHLHDELDLRKSIHQNIEFILRAFTLSFRFDPSFGSVMNKFQATTPPQNKTERAWRESIRQDIQKNLKDIFSRYETRVKIRDVIVDFTKSKARKIDNSLAHVSIQVIGNLTIGRKEAFHFPDSEVDEDAKEVFPLMIPMGKVKS